MASQAFVKNIGRGGAGGGQKRGRAAVRTVVHGEREYAVKDDSAPNEEDGASELSGLSNEYENESSEEDYEEETKTSFSGGGGGHRGGHRGGEDRMQSGRPLEIQGEGERALTPAQKWMERVQEFQCNREELLRLNRGDMERRVRDLDVLLLQLSTELTTALTEQSELCSETEILDITIGQLMERISPGHINIKNGSHKKGRSFPKPNTTRKFFDMF